MFDSVVKVSGYWDMKLHGPNGELKDHVAGKNVVTSAGKEMLANFLSSAAAAASTFTTRYLAVGTGSTTETAADTALAVETARVSGIVSSPSASVYVVVGTVPAGTATGTIVEYGLLNSASAGTMLARKTASAISKGALDTLTVTARITFS